MSTPPVSRLVGTERAVDIGAVPQVIAVSGLTCFVGVVVVAVALYPGVEVGGFAAHALTVDDPADKVRRNNVITLLRVDVYASLR